MMMYVFTLFMSPPSFSLFGATTEEERGKANSGLCQNQTREKKERTGKEKQPHALLVDLTEIRQIYSFG